MRLGEPTYHMRLGEATIATPRCLDVRVLLPSEASAVATSFPESRRAAFARPAAWHAGRSAARPCLDLFRTYVLDGLLAKHIDV